MQSQFKKEAKGSTKYQLVPSIVSDLFIINVPSSCINHAQVYK